MRTNAAAIIEVAHYIDDAKVTLGPDGESVLYGGAHLSDFSPVYADAGIPGVLVRPLIADESGNTDTDLNNAFLSQLASLWTHRLALSGYFTAEQVARAVAIIGKGLMVVPSNSTAIKNIDPTHPNGLFTPALANQDADHKASWDRITAEFKSIVTAYLKGEFEDARAKGAALEANVAFWDSVYTTVQDLPGDVAGFASRSILHALGSILLNPYVLGLGAVAVVGFIVYRRGSVAILKAAAGK